jgi:prepilin-type processing-associated H-X9-DG protein
MQSKSACHRRVGGFTLVELLVVVGIMALLISLLLPALKRARGAAEQAVCLSNIRQLMVADMLYSVDNKGLIVTYGFGSNLPTSSALPTLTGTIDGLTGPIWQSWNGGYTGVAGGSLLWDWKYGLISKYMQSVKPYWCPSMNPDIPLGSNGSQAYVTYPPTSYGLASPTPFVTKMTQIYSTSRTVSFADTIGCYQVYPDGPKDFDFGQKDGITAPGIYTRGVTNPPSFHGRHNGKRGSVAFFDGHAEAMLAYTFPTVNGYAGRGVNAAMFAVVTAQHIGDIITADRATPGVSPNNNYYFSSGIK